MVVSGPPAERIAALAKHQRGRVARRQLLAGGISAGMIKRRLRSGELIRLYPGVYAVGHEANIELGREAAALLACRPGALLSHATAAALWRIRPPQRVDAPIHVLVHRAAATRKQGICCHRTNRLHPKDVRYRHELPVTSPARTLLDIAPEVSTRELEWALDEALSHNLVRKSEIRNLLVRSAGQPGMPLLAALLDHRTTGPTRSGLEQRFLELIRSAGLPQPDTNVLLDGFLVDAYWPDHRVVFEVDSHLYHSTASAFQRDRVKEAALKGRNLDVNRVSDYQLEHEAHAVIAFVAQRLALATPRPSAA